MDAAAVVVAVGVDPVAVGQSIGPALQRPSRPPPPVAPLVAPPALPTTTESVVASQAEDPPPLASEDRSDLASGSRDRVPLGLNAFAFGGPTIGALPRVSGWLGGGLAPSRPAAPAPDPDPTLAAEAKLVRAIKAAVSTDPKRALELVAEHDARFSEGVLSAEAASLRVDALCRLGRQSEAKQAAGAIPRTHPSATVATAGCPQKKSTSPTSAGEPRGI